MRQAYEDRDRTARVGQAASRAVRDRFTWQRTAQAMAERIVKLAGHAASTTSAGSTTPNAIPESAAPRLTACLLARGAERKIAHALAQVAPFVDEMVVVIAGTPDRSEAVAKEYGAKTVALSDGADERQAAGPLITADWVFWLDPADRLWDFETERLREHLAQQPPEVSEVLIDMPKSRWAGNSEKTGGKLRICRHQANGASSAPALSLAGG
jgi:hypothetical protein